MLNILSNIFYCKKYFKNKLQIKRFKQFDTYICECYINKNNMCVKKILYNNINNKLDHIVTILYNNLGNFTTMFVLKDNGTRLYESYFDNNKTLICIKLYNNDNEPYIEIFNNNTVYTENIV